MCDTCTKLELVSCPPRGTDDPGLNAADLRTEIDINRLAGERIPPEPVDATTELVLRAQLSVVDSP